MTKPDIVYRYTGKDPEQAHHSGIPARDLTQEDVDGLDKEHRATLRISPIYRKVEPPNGDDEHAKARPAAPRDADADEPKRDAGKKESKP
jgi:hypothetical protein